MAPKPWISIPKIKIYLETKFRPNRRIFVFWRPFWIQNGRHSKLTMHINSQHHNLLGSQISPKSEDFCIWWPCCTLVTMEIVLNPPLFVSMATAAKFVQPIPIFFFGLSRSTKCGCCSYQVSTISVRRVTCYDHFCVFQFFSILAVSMATAAILKIPKVVCTSTHSA